MQCSEGEETSRGRSETGKSGKSCRTMNAHFVLLLSKSCFPNTQRGSVVERREGLIPDRRKSEVFCVVFVLLLNLLG